MLTFSAAAATAGTWSTTGSMTVARQTHTATLLADGTVLVAGGCDVIFDVCLPGTSRATAEIYNPATGTWSATASMSIARWFHTATLLTDGRVLVAGGCAPEVAADECLPGDRRASAEIYDPTTGTWSSTGSMSVARVGHTATLLTDGTVLVAGGSDGADAEVYDPTTGTWLATGSMTVARDRHTATLLMDGTVLVVGGSDAAGFASATAELYDPATANWSATGSMIVGRRFGHTATLLMDGTVLVAGGSPGGASAELYDPSTGTWSATGSTSIARGGHTATLLTDGRVLVAGGFDATGFGSATAELYDPTTGTWSATASMNVGRGAFTATLLTDGTVLVAGGIANDPSSAEIFSP